MTSDEEEVGGDFTVYECPGLAPVSYGPLAWPTHWLWLSPWQQRDHGLRGRM